MWGAPADYFRRVPLEDELAVRLLPRLGPGADTVSRLRIGAEGRAGGVGLRTGGPCRRVLGGVGRREGVWEARTVGRVFGLSGFLTAGRGVGLGVGRMLRTGVGVRGDSRLGANGQGVGLGVGRMLRTGVGVRWVGLLGTEGRVTALGIGRVAFTRTGAGVRCCGRLGVEGRFVRWLAVWLWGFERWTGAWCERGWL